MPPFPTAPGTPSTPPPFRLQMRFKQFGHPSRAESNHSCEIASRQISSVCYILHKELSKHFPSGRAGSVIGSFYMLRFICPALVSPVKMGFVDSTATNVAGLFHRDI